MKRKSKTNLIIIATAFVVLQSCETVSSLSEKIYQGSVDTFDYVGSVFSDESSDVEESEQSDGENKILSAQPPENQEQNSSAELSQTNKDEEVNLNQNLTNSDQILEAVPAEDLDVVTLNNENSISSENDDVTKNTKLDNIKPESDFIAKSEVIKKNFELMRPKLELEDKIQFRIATINFNSGSSQLTFNDIKKIKRVMKLANEKNAKVRIVGHASTRTRDMDLIKHKLANFTISDKRSHAVAKVFIDNKFPVDNLITEAVSDSKPLFHESMPAGTYGNQRTEIYIIY